MNKLKFLWIFIVAVMALGIPSLPAQSDNFFFIDDGWEVRDEDNTDYSGIWGDELLIVDYETADILPVGNGIWILSIMAISYVIFKVLKRRRSILKTNALLVMSISVLLLQCKKSGLVTDEPQSPEGEAISICLTAGNGGRTDIDVQSGRITWDAGDKVYVVNNGALLSGFLTAKSGSSIISEISGTVTGSIDDTKPFYFYYVGDGVVMNSSAGSISFNISTQTDGGFDVGEYQIGRTSGIIMTNDGGRYVPADVNPNPIPFKPMTAVLRLDTETSFGSGIMTMGGSNVRNIMAIDLADLTISYSSGNVIFTSGADTRVSAFPTGTPEGETEKISFTKGVYSGEIGVLNGIIEARVYCKVIDNEPFPIAVAGRPIGTLPGIFSVSDTKQVYFAQGNLQYIGSAANPYWRFAGNQWDFFGSTTGQGTDSQNVDRDLFGYGTSGYNSKMPYMTSTTDADYPWVSFSDGNINYDWGMNNAISNGGDMAGMWRTLNNTMPADIGISGDWHCHGGEWDYLVYDRDNNSAYHSEGKYLSGTGTLTLNDLTTVFGAFILPDYYYGLPGARQQTAGKFGWSYTQDELTGYDIVFLPGSGSRNGLTINSGVGNYWSSSNNPANDRRACNIWFNATNFLQTNSTPSYFIHNGYAVRLVVEVE